MKLLEDSKRTNKGDFYFSFFNVEFNNVLSQAGRPALGKKWNEIVRG